MAKYTPGPWHVVKGPNGREIRATDGTDIAQVYNGRLMYGERNANARLIAAAPDLLKCLRYALAHIDGGDVGGYRAVLDDGYAAIAKAEPVSETSETPPPTPAA